MAANVGKALAEIASLAFDAGFKSLAVRCGALAKIHATDAEGFASALDQTITSCEAGVKALTAIVGKLRDVRNLAARKAA